MLELILNKLILEAEPGLEGCLLYLSNWLLDFPNDNTLKKSKELITEIIRKYSISAPEDIDLPFLREKIISIAFVLKKWNVQDPIIDQLCNEITSSRFNNVKYSLPKKLKEKKIL